MSTRRNTRALLEESFLLTCIPITHSTFIMENSVFGTVKYSVVHSNTHPHSNSSSVEEKGVELQQTTEFRIM